MRKIFFISIGILVSVLFIGLSVSHMDWARVFRVLSNVQLYPWVLFGVGSYVVGFFLRGLRTKLLVSCDAQLSVFTSSNIVSTGYAVNNIIPARLGELARAGMMSERIGIPIAQSLTVVFFERVLDGTAIALLGAIGLSMMKTGGGTIRYSYLMPLIFAASLMALLLVAYTPQRFINFISKTMIALNRRWHDTSLRIATSMVNGVAYIRQPVNFIKILFVSIMIWFCDTGLFLCLLPAFGIAISLWQVFCIMSSANLGILFYISPGYSSPGHIGPFHALVMQGLMLFGCAQPAALGFAITLHCAIYIPIMIWGGAVILWYCIMLGIKFGLTRKATVVYPPPEPFGTQAARLGRTSSEPIKTTHSALVYALAEAALARETSQCANPKAAISYAADFVQGEIENLSKKMKLLFSIGMIGFNVLVWCRYLQRFTVLPLETRERIFNSWAYGKIPLARQLFKLVRTTTLLAFFEHPDVVRTLENGTGFKRL